MSLQNPPPVVAPTPRAFVALALALTLALTPGLTPGSGV